MKEKGIPLHDLICPLLVAASLHCFHSFDQLGRPTEKKPTKNIWRKMFMYMI